MELKEGSTNQAPKPLQSRSIFVVILMNANHWEKKEKSSYSDLKLVESNCSHLPHAPLHPHPPLTHSCAAKGEELIR